MKSFWRGLSLCALLLLGSCATTPAESKNLPTDAEVEQYNASVPPEERIVCRDETQVGSNIPRRVCRYIADIDETSQFTRSELNRVLR
jgi:hypothetical protein